VESLIRITYDGLPTVEVREHSADEQGNIFTLLRPLPYRTLIIPAGFESDGASVPRFLWGAVFPRDDRQALFGALVHDYCYRTHPFGCTKNDADMAFYELMRKGGVSYIRAQKAYWGVRLFGKSSWNAGGIKQ
jgi:hypothetical protein